MDNTVRIAEMVSLPSKGMVYEGEISDKVELKSMTTRHEMLRLSASESTNKIMADILDDCIVDDLGISAYDLCLGDFQFLLYKLRIVTFGPDYELNSICPVCGSPIKLDMNLDDSEVNLFDESLVDKLTLYLPTNGEKVELALSTPRVMDRIDKQVKEYRNKHKGSIENPYLLYLMLNSIVTVDDESIINPIAYEEWVKDLPLRDLNVLRQRIDDINSMIGVKLTINTNCTVCGEEVEVPFRVSEQFFRPSVE